MSEKKYYVKLKSPNDHKGIWWRGDRSEWQPYSYVPVYGEELDDWGEREVIGWKVSEFIPSFTKSELGKIMGGAILKRIPGGTPLDELGKDKSCYVWLDDCNYWKNPLIELVPVEDEE
ncbi:hypothetical protein P7H89_03835 [Lactococcus lactis]|uniref:hypothetical protein n=1 Tax=Lactococcus lactis TaxID=1358 RepID=UPI00288DCBBE|nr:hypothetical protein [Lactococcus lactis]MDT2891627.1 hypothetical protein [Lactococcus lactis]